DRSAEESYATQRIASGRAKCYTSLVASGRHQQQSAPTCSAQLSLAVLLPVPARDAPKFSIRFTFLIPPRYEKESKESLLMVLQSSFGASHHHHRANQNPKLSKNPN
uniref:Uncharacterized protein n=1 Tax=Aegilops tauschii subsp. strangulata TaxID=200361 RepID=A0A453B217_AEGTS